MALIKQALYRFIRVSEYTPLSLLIFCLLLTTIVYYPSLYSGTLLDDYANLGSLQSVEKYGYLNYIFGGNAGPSGRPLSLLSFALQYQDWPDNPARLKAVNLVLHLLNGAMIFFICNMLAARLRLCRREAVVLSLVTTLLWLLHPMQISTVLYTVQRMTQLSAFFMLLGLLGYLWARIHLREQRGGLMLMSISVAGGTILGLLSKENAIMLPLYILVIESTLLAQLPATRLWKTWRAVFLITPLLMLLAYLGITLPETLEGYQYKREFTASQRLLTQPTVLLDYLSKLILPRPGAFGLFHDDYIFATSLIEPPITLVAIISWLVLVGFAISARQGRHKILAFAILWFGAGHLLEASHLNLELYFEHRNYLPALGVFMLLAYLSILAGRHLSNRYLSLSLSVCFLILMLGITIDQLKLWRQPLLQTAEWLHRHPRSARAIDHMGAAYLALGRHQQAIEVYQDLKDIYPQDIYPYIKELSIRACMMKEQVSAQFWEDILRRAKHAKKHGVAFLVELDHIVIQWQQNNCQIDQYIKLLKLILGLALNPDFQGYKAFLHELAATVLAHMNEPNASLANIDEAIRSDATPARYILKIRILLTYGMKQQAETTLEEFQQFLIRHPRYWLANKEIFKEIKSLLKS